MINAPSQTRAEPNAGIFEPANPASPHLPNAPAAAPAWPLYLGIDVAKAERVTAVRVAGRTGQATADANTSAGIHKLVRRLAYMGALSAMRYNPHIKQCAARWQSPQTKGNGRPLTPKQTVGAAMNKLARQMFGVLKSGQPYQPCQPIAA